MRTTRSVAALAAAVALVLTGCSDGDDTAATGQDAATQEVEIPASPDSADDADDAEGNDEATDSDDAPDNSDSDGSSDSGDTPADSGASQDGSVNGADLSGIDLANPPAPIGEVVIPIGGERHTETKVELLRLERMDDTVVIAVMRLTPTTTGSDPMRLFEVLGRTGGAVLIDVTNLKKYSAIDQLGSDRINTRTQPNEPMYAWVAFPAPPSGATIHLQPSSIAPMIEGLTAP